MKRGLVWLLCAVMLLELLGGCSGVDGVYVPTGDGLTKDEGASTQETSDQEPTPEQELTLVYYPEVTLNPYKCTDFTNRTLFSLIYQSLFVVDNNYQTSPMLCSKYYVSENMRSYTFFIGNATFSDGTQLTIEDVYASYQAAKASTFYSGRFLHVLEITLTEDGGINFALDTAYENFPMLLDIPIVKSTEVEADRPLGTGPYYMEQTGGGMRLRRRTNWWCEAEMIVTASSINLKEAESVTQIRDSFEFDDVGLVCANPGSEYYVDYRCDYELWDCENGIFMYLSCNTNSELFSNVAVRSALTYAIDRDAIVSEFYGGFAHSATLPASPLSPYYSTQLAGRYEYDSAKFTQAISDAYMTGYTVRFLVNNSDTMRLRVARSIAKMLEQCGVTVEMLEYTGKTYMYFLNAREYDLYLGQTKLSPNMDLTAFFRGGGTLRYGGMVDADIYAMCTLALANQGNYYNLHKKIMEDGRLCPVLFQTYSVHATRGLLTGLVPSRDNVFYYSLGKTMDDVLTEKPAPPPETQQ